MRILITGGAGFIGSHLADELLEHGHEVRALDSLVSQVHEDGERPAYLSRDVELIVGDVRDADVVSRALRGADAVYHFAARVGVGQSMYEIAEYTATNNLGTAVLLEALARRPVERLVVASSMSLYGEGRYRGLDGTVVDDASRTPEQLRRGQWDPVDGDGAPLVPVPTPESKAPRLASVYALGKFDQEQLALMLGQAYGIPTVALRFFNVYGPRQALSNPYTGVLAIFAARLLNGAPPLIFEDGLQQRDFVSVRDVARACRLALEEPPERVSGHAFNVGSGEAWRVSSVAGLLSRALGVSIEPEITGQSRVGDIRHCFADLTQAREGLGYEPSVPLADGIVELAAWLVEQRAIDRVATARAELDRRGLTV
ncbi:MAG TPA: NAD-dependent epimerase/dehydratase family protein [Vicinamibacterales bacterium]